MKVLNLLVIVLALIFPATSFAGRAYYVDADAPSGGDGSFERPFQTIAEVNAYRFSTGDDVYFQAGDSWNVSQVLSIDWDGSKDDPVVIGAYHGKNKFGLNGKARPVLDANGTGGKLSSGLISYRMNGGVGYIQIMDIHIQNTIGYGVEINGWNGALGNGYVTDCLVKNVYTKNTASMGIELMRTHKSLVLGCTVVDSNQDLKNYRAGNGIDINAAQKEDRSQHNTVRGCTVIRGYEGIGTYLGARYTTIEDNVVADCRTFYIYSANSRDGVIRNNIVYATPNFRGSARGYGIIIDNEGHNPNVKLRVTGGYEIYGNMIAGLDIGIGLMNNGYVNNIYQTNNYIHNNKIVDCGFNFKFLQNDPNWSDNIIESNYSFVFTEQMEHTNVTTPYGVQWKGNFFNNSVKGALLNSASIGEVKLVKDNGWRHLTLGSLTADDFSVVTENGTAIGDSTHDSTPVTVDAPKGIRIGN